jgi:hypothetical protein
MMEFVNGKDDIPYIVENKSHVPNHQPVNYGYGSSRNEKGHPDHGAGPRPGQDLLRK